MQRKSLLRAICFLLLGAMAGMLHAQTNGVESLTIKDGLSQGYVSAILQDREGFLWIGTKNGLNRYDGSRFKVFTVDPSDPWAISNDFILSIQEYNDFLLIGTNGGGLNIFHKKTQRFYRLPDQLPDGTRMGSPIIYKTYMDVQGDLWVYFWKEKTYKEGRICHIRLPKDFWERLPDTDRRWAGISTDLTFSEPVLFSHMSRDGKNLWLSNLTNIYCLDTKTSAIQARVVPPGMAILNLGQDTLGDTWVFGSEQLMKIDGAGEHLYKSDFESELFFGIDQQNRLLTKAVDKTFIRIPMNRIINGGVHLRDADLTVPNMAGNRMITDRSGNIWMATAGYGLQKITPWLGRFRTYFEPFSIYSPPFSDAEGSIGYFDFAKGPVVYPESSRHPLAGRGRKLPLLTANSRGIQDCAGHFWTMYENNGRTMLQRSASPGKPEKSFQVPEMKEYAGNITVDDQCMIWIAQNGVLARFDPSTEQFMHFDYYSLISLGHEVRALTRTANRHWWIATEFGLVEAIPNGDGYSFKRYQQDPGSPNGLHNDNLSSLLVDPKDANLLWIGTKGGGLERLDTRTGQFTHLTTRNGLPNDVIYGVLNDDSGNLWMSSNLGLIRYNPATGNIKNFTEADGLLSNEFNTWAYGKTPAGELMFGGVKGLHVLNPKDWKDNPITPLVHITGLKVNGRPISPGDSTGILRYAPEWTRQISLSFAQNSIALDFAALEFSTPSKNRFRYYLEGAEPAWAHEGTEHSAQYLNLQPGKYAFKVMAGNGDGQWNPNPAVLELEVLPPWYRSIWAWLVYAGMAGAVVFGYLRFRLHRLQLQQQLALEHLEAGRLKELDEFKSRFFTNISHEFRTPLTVILGTTGQLSAEASPPLKDKLNLVRRSGENLLRLVNQILDLARLESNALKMNYIQGDVLSYLHYVAESLHSLANAKNVMLKVESTAVEINLDYDPERLLQIVHNLLSNAIKFTPSGGKVTLRADLVANGPGQNQQALQLTVSDTGAGIPPEDQPYLFDRFFQARNQEFTKQGGSGIGLSLTKELVRAMKGSISLESAVGVGSVFKVLLPVHRDAPMEQWHEDPVEARQQIAGTALNRRTEDSNAPTLLLIEDNADVVEYLGACLGETYQLEYAYNGRAGIEKALEVIPDIIISDVMMPEKDGLEVCETLKHDERTSHVPIVLLTAKVTIEDRISGLRRGADAYLAKPFHQEELLAVLDNLLAIRRKLQARYAGAGPLPPAATEVERTEDAFLQKMRAAIETRLSDSGFSGEDLCRVMGMSYSVVYRKLSALTGRSLNIYIRLIRLGKAREMLLQTELSISEIAYETGFNDPKFFSRVFSEEYGEAPSVFRQRSGK